MGQRKFRNLNVGLVQSAGANNIQIFPIDTAKVRYQRNCLIQVKGKTESTSIKFFNKGNYRGLGISMGRSAVVNGKQSLVERRLHRKALYAHVYFSNFLLYFRVHEEGYQRAGNQQHLSLSKRAWNFQHGFFAYEPVPTPSKRDLEISR